MLGEQIKIARERVCMSQEALAEAIGMHTNTVARWERNEVTPRGNSLKKLAQALQVQPSYLLDSEKNENADIHNLKKEHARTKETASESVSPLCLSYTGVNGDKLELPDTPKNRELFQMLVVKMISKSNSDKNLGVINN